MSFPAGQRYQAVGLQQAIRARWELGGIRGVPVVGQGECTKRRGGGLTWTICLVLFLL